MVDYQRVLEIGDPPPRPSAEAVVRPGGASPTKILIVEDDRATREGLEDLLGGLSSLVASAATLDEGKRALQRFDPDICLTDLKLPDGNGIDFIRSALPEGSKRDVIVLTGNGSIDTAVEAMKAGAFDYLLKPVRPKQIGIVLERLEKKRGIEKQLRDQEGRFKALIEHSSDAIALLSPSGSVLYASPSTDRVLGYPADEMSGADWFGHVVDEDRAPAREFFTALAADPGRHASFECRMRSRSGEILWIETTLTNLLNESGVGAVVVNYRDVTERRRAVDDLEYRAFHDSLTGLPNRALFLDRLNQAMARARRDGGKLAVMFIDLDDLKSVNDTLGHSGGDELIRALTERLRGCVREADTLARVGGDEFTLLVPEVSDETDAVTVATKTLASVAEPFLIQGRRLKVTTSIGIGFYPRDGADPETLMACADKALYRAKQTGKNRYRFCSPFE